MPQVGGVFAAFGVVLFAGTLVHALAFFNLIELLMGKVEEWHPDAEPEQKVRTLSIWLIVGTILHLAIAAVLLWLTLWCFERTGFGVARYLLPAYIGVGVLSCLWQSAVGLMFRVWAAGGTALVKAAFLSWAAWLTFQRV